MQSEDLQRLLKSLQESQGPALAAPSIPPPPPSSAPNPGTNNNNSLDDLLRDLRTVSGPPHPPSVPAAPSHSPPVPPQTSTSFQTFHHAQADPLTEHNQAHHSGDEDEDDDYQMYEALSRPDLRFCSYPESLSILGDLCQSAGYISQLKALKKAQEDWEIRQLHQRNRILMGIRKQTHTARDLKNHDLETLAMFDELRVKQQKKLEELGTPVFSATQEKEALKRQQKILQTLEMALEDIDASTNTSKRS